jgi:hypothetical protein
MDEIGLTLDDFCSTVANVNVLGTFKEVKLS